MRHVRNMSLAALILVSSGLLVEMPAAEARGGGSSFMNSPGYQRRLQESRGYVTNQSGSLVTPDHVVTPRPHIRPKPRRRH